MKKELHAVQKKLMDLLEENIEDPLTIRQLQYIVGASSTSVVAHHISQLEKKGYLKKNPSNPRDYQLMTYAPEKQVAYLNMYGLASCGKSGSILDGSPIDRIPISPKLIPFPSSEAFVVRAKGDSMSPRINKGDTVIARKTKHVKNGQIAVCVNDGEALIKKIHHEDKKIILISLNPNFPPFLASSDFRIEGEVKVVISHV